MKVEVQNAILRWARTRAGLSVQVLARSFPRLELWELGKEHPTMRQLEAFARKTATPLGYFFLPEPPEDKLPIPDFRTVGDASLRRPSPNLLETVEIMQRRQAWLREFLVEQGQERLAFLGSVTVQDAPTAVAAKIKKALALAPDWAEQHGSWTAALRTLRRVIEDARIVVVANGVVGNNTSRKLDPAEFRGFVLCDDYAPLIFVNNADAKGAQMFTLAHELAHLWLGRPGVFSFTRLQAADNDVERFCNQVAAEFLVPAEAMQASWVKAKVDPEPFQMLARQFKVSPLVTARRALDLGLVGRPEFFAFYDAYLADERRGRATATGGGDFYANQDARLGRLFAHSVGVATREGRLLYAEAYRLTGLCGKTFDKYIQHLAFPS